MPTIAPYGSWTSPVTIDLLTANVVQLGYVDITDEGVYWIEGRASEGGRSVLVFRPRNGEPVDVVPAAFNVRTRVQEYGGGAWCRHAGTVFVSSFDDGRLYRIDEPGAEPVPITPDPPEVNALRYADGRVTADGRLLLCVRERHGEGDPANELVAVTTDGSAEPQVIAAGHDFYSSPRISPDGSRLAWTTWDHPQLPFDGTELWVADLAADGSLSHERLVAGSTHESIVQPEWSVDGVLHFVSDRSGWWNLYAERDGQPVALCPMEAEFAYPPWVFGLTRYAFLEDGRIACILTRQGFDSLELLDPRTGRLDSLDLSYTTYPAATLQARGNTLATVAASETEYMTLVLIDIESRGVDVIQHGLQTELDPEFISSAEPIEFAGAEGETAYGLLYRPRNPEYAAPDGELPPLIVGVHGGPTAHTSATLSLTTQFFTSRGLAVVEVNYGGSTGYGRVYRERLRERWGVVDVQDCVEAARYLAEQGEVDPDRLLITGGSAGGYTTLMAMAVEDVFAAGISEFGVADLVTFRGTTHKFEANYDQSLVGAWPELAERYRERSPITHADQISRPLLLLQGLDDKIVPPSQSEQIVEALRRQGVPYAYLEFEGEGHGFRKGESIRRALEAELSFLGQIFDFEPADELEPVRVENLEGAPH